jgi:hypothetical protein
VKRWLVFQGSEDNYGKVSAILSSSDPDAPGPRVYDDPDANGPAAVAAIYMRDVGVEFAVVFPFVDGRAFERALAAEERT